jgi:hypothetical protein
VSAPLIVAPQGPLLASTQTVSGQMGTLGLTIVDEDGDIVVAHTTAGITEMPAGSGLYFTTVSAPSNAGQYVIEWDSGATMAFVVSAVFDVPFTAEEPRGIGFTKRAPRGYDKAARSVYAMLPDQAYIVRELDTGQVDDGTPILTATDYGPYRARISPVARTEQRDSDKYTAVESHTLQIATDLIIVESDLFDIVCQDPTRSSSPGVLLRYRVPTGVAPRTPGWRTPLIWRVPIQLTTEY